MVSFRLKKHKSESESLLGKKGAFQGKKSRRSEDDDIIGNRNNRRFGLRLGRRSSRLKMEDYDDDRPLEIEYHSSTPPVTPYSSPADKQQQRRRQEHNSTNPFEDPHYLRTPTKTGPVRKSKTLPTPPLKSSSKSRRPVSPQPAGHRARGSATTATDNSVVSELTNPHELQHNHQQQLSLREPPRTPGDVVYGVPTDGPAVAMKKQILESSGGGGPASLTESTTTQQTSKTPRTTTPTDPEEEQQQPLHQQQHANNDDDIVTTVLGLMDFSCFTPFQQGNNEHRPTTTHEKNSIVRNLSFMPEWGVAPPQEEEDGGHDDAPRPGGGSRRSDSTLQTYDYDPSYSTDLDTRESTTVTNHRPPSRNTATPNSMEENFEMVLEEEEEDEVARQQQQQQHQRSDRNHRRGWRKNSKKKKEVDLAILGITKRESPVDTDAPPSAMLAAAYGSVQSRRDKTVRDIVVEQQQEEKKEDDVVPPLKKPMPNARRSNLTPPAQQQRQQQQQKTAAVAKKVAAPQRTTPLVATLDIPQCEELETIEEVIEEAYDRTHKSDPTSNNRSRKSIPNPASALLRKARSARERKRAADKERRYKKILQSLKTPKETLPTVDEASKESNENSSPDRVDHVRVPGIQTADQYLKPSELLGNEYIEENNNFISARSSSSSSLSKQHSNQAVTRPRALSDDNIPTGRVLSAKKEAPAIGRSKSWREKLHLGRPASGSASNNKLSNTDGAKSDPGAFSMRAAASALLAHATMKRESQSSNKKADFGDPSKEGSRPTRAASAREKQSGVIEKKAYWKPVADPSSGRTYYYHRITRKTRWDKPPNDEIVSAKPDKSERKEALLRKKTARDFDPNVWVKKEEIANIVTTMAPSTGKTLDRLVSEYEGKEDTLLDRLKTIADSKPFDEPAVQSVSSENKSGPAGTDMKPGSDHSRTGRGPVSRSRTGISTDGSRTGASVAYSRASVRTGTTSNYSGFSGRLSEVTPQIKNTRKPHVISAIMEDDDATSISSKQLYELPNQAGSPARSAATNSSLPSHVPVPRRRELNVEEFSSDRKIETYDTKRNFRGSRNHAQWSDPLNVPKTPMTRRVPRAKQSLHYDLSAYLGDNEETDKESASFENSAVNDSVSALSEEQENLNGLSADAVRRKALNDAIAREEWDLAAALSDGLRANAAKQAARRNANIRPEWVQSELDRFISENDWDAVAAYIAQLRANSADEEKKESDTNQYRRPLTPGGTHPSKEIDPGTNSLDSPTKRFGARSQLQHSSLDSGSSWESSNNSSYDSDYSSEDTESYSEASGARAPPRRRKKEFAC